MAQQIRLDFPGKIAPRKDFKMTTDDMKVLMAIYDKQYEIVSELITLYSESSNLNIMELSKKGIDFLYAFAKIFNDEKEF